MTTPSQKTRIAVFGIGYVGMAMAIVLSRRARVRALDIDPARVTALNAGQYHSPASVRCEEDEKINQNRKRGETALYGSAFPDDCAASSSHIASISPHTSVTPPSSSLLLRLQEEKSLLPYKAL